MYELVLARISDGKRFIKTFDDWYSFNKYKYKMKHNPKVIIVSEGRYL